MKKILFLLLKKSRYKLLNTEMLIHQWFKDLIYLLDPLPMIL